MAIEEKGKSHGDHPEVQGEASDGSLSGRILRKALDGLRSKESGLEYPHDERCEGRRGEF